VPRLLHAMATPGRKTECLSDREEHGSAAFDNR
jgi:hypothetical protein